MDPSQHRRRPGDAACRRRAGSRRPPKANVAAFSILDRIAWQSLHVPARDVLTDAATDAGLCRLQGYAKDRRMKALHDGTVFCQARRLGGALLAAKVGDFGCLQPLRPRGRVLFHETV